MVPLRFLVEEFSFSVYHEGTFFIPILSYILSRSNEYTL